jgi:hypothetical protein
MLKPTSHNTSKVVALSVLFLASAAIGASGAVTWGTNSYPLPDGAVCEQMVNDGGFADAGFADAGADGGPNQPGTWDGGVCADGGTGVDCTACGGTCQLSDGGNGPVDGGPVDGGWLPGAPITVGINSDPIPAENSLKATCQCTGTPNNNASITMQIQGSTDPTNPQVWLALPNSSFTVALNDGGVGAASGDLQTQGTVGKWNRLNQTAANGDGGLCCCTYEAN